MSADGTTLRRTGKTTKTAKSKTAGADVKFLADFKEKQRLARFAHVYARFLRYNLGGLSDKNLRPNTNTPDKTLYCTRGLLRHSSFFSNRCSNG